MDELYRLSAHTVVGLLAKGELSPLDLIDAAAARIAETDPAINALPTLCLERARDHASRLKQERPGAAANTWLGGLPLAVKDLNDVAGVRTTYGSPIFADHVPRRSDIMVETLERHGGIVIAKSNTPEFGLGANTFNTVFGKTRNPWNTALSAGGSSGGSAAALAAGQCWLATGSDFGCSLRTPAAFCGVVALRPAPGRVARTDQRLPYDNLWVQGPMGRSVADVALMLDAMVGENPGDPISLPAPTNSFMQSVTGPVAPRRVAYSADLGGLTPVTREIADICAKAAARLVDIGARVEEASPDLSTARDIFPVIRAARLVADLGPIVDAHPDRVKPEALWEFDQAKALTAVELGKAERARAALYMRAASFFDTYDLLVTPATVVMPFDVDLRTIDEIEGQRLNAYYEWYAIAYAITLTSLPALVLPCGFSASGLPVGLQVISAPRAEARLISAASLMEQLFDVVGRLPVDPRAARS